MKIHSIKIFSAFCCYLIFSHLSFASPGPPPPRTRPVLASYTEGKEIPWLLLGSDLEWPSVYVWPGKLFYLSNLHKILLRLDPLTGEVIWKFQAKNEVKDFWEAHGHSTAKLGICGPKGREVLILDAGEHIVLDIEDGSTLYGVATGDSLACEGEVLLAIQNKKLSRIDTSNGSVVWEKSVEYPGFSVAESPRGGLLLQTSGSLNHLDSETGILRWQTFPSADLDLRWDFVSSKFSQTTIADLGNWIFLKSSQSTSINGISKSYVSAIELNSGKIGWNHEIFPTISSQPKSHAKDQRKRFSGSIFSFKPEKVDGRIVFYDGWRIVVVSASQSEPPVSIWPEPSLEDDTEIEKMLPVPGEAAVVLRTRNLKDQSTSILKIDLSGKELWRFKSDHIFDIEILGIHSEVLFANFREYERAKARENQLDSGSLGINLKNGEIAWRSDRSIHGSVDANTLPQGFGQVSKFDEMLNLSNGQTEKSQNSSVMQEMLARKPKRVGKLNFVLGKVTWDQEAPPLEFRKLEQLDTQRIASGLVPTSAEIPTPTPNHQDQKEAAIHALKIATGGELVKAFGEAARLKLNSQEILSLMKNAIVAGRCKNYSCLSPIVMVNTPESWRTALELLQVAGEDERQSIYFTLTRTDQIENLSPENRNSLATLALKDLETSKIACAAADFLMQLDLPQSKEGFDAYRRTLRENLRNFADKKLLVQSVNQVACLKHCGADALEDVAQVFEHWKGTPEDESLQRAVETGVQRLAPYGDKAASLLMGIIDFRRAQYKNITREWEQQAKIVSICQSIVALGTSKSSEAKALVDQLLSDSDQEIKRCAIRALSQSLEDRDIRKIFTFLRSADPKLKAAASESLRNNSAVLKGHEVELLEFVNNEADERIRQDLFRLLPASDPTVASILLEFQPRASPELRFLILEATPYLLQPEEAIKQLQLATKDSSVPIQRLAEKMLKNWAMYEKMWSYAQVRNVDEQKITKRSTAEDKKPNICLEPLLKIVAPITPLVATAVPSPAFVQAKFFPKFESDDSALELRNTTWRLKDVLKQVRDRGIAIDKLQPYMDEVVKALVAQLPHVSSKPLALYQPAESFGLWVAAQFLVDGQSIRAGEYQPLPAKFSIESKDAFREIMPHWEKFYASIDLAVEQGVQLYTTKAFFARTVAEGFAGGYQASGRLFLRNLNGSPRQTIAFERTLGNQALLGLYQGLSQDSRVPPESDYHQFALIRFRKEEVWKIDDIHSIRFPAYGVPVGEAYYGALIVLGEQLIKFSSEQGVAEVLPVVRPEIIGSMSLQTKGDCVVSLYINQVKQAEDESGYLLKRILGGLRKGKNTVKIIARRTKPNEIISRKPSAQIVLWRNNEGGGRRVGDTTGSLFSRDLDLSQDVTLEEEFEVE